MIEATLTEQDCGPGIPEAELVQVFEPFHRGDAAGNLDRPGSGLGLAIVADAVRHHQGRIGSSNRSRGGLCVSLSLPVG